MYVGSVRTRVCAYDFGIKYPELTIVTFISIVYITIENNVLFDVKIYNLG